MCLNCNPSTDIIYIQLCFEKIRETIAVDLRRFYYNSMENATHAKTHAAGIDVFYVYYNSIKCSLAQKIL